MNKKYMSQKVKQLLFFIIGLFVSIGFDQWTKQLVVTHLKGNLPFVIWEGVFELYYSENRGAAFGIMQGKQGFFFVIAAIVIIGVFYLLYRMPSEKKYFPFTGCLFLLVSGAVGNLIDRLLNGYVVDFLYFKLINFPIFNVADCYVVISTISLMILFFFVYSEEDLTFLSIGKKTKKGEI